MELTPKLKAQIDTILSVHRWTGWGIGIIGMTLVVSFLIYASYWTVADGIVIGMLYVMMALLLGTVFVRYRMWLRFVTNQKARNLLTFRMMAQTLAFSGIGLYGVFYFSSGANEPQSFLMFLATQVIFLAVDYLGKRLDRVIQSHDENYLTGRDLKAIQDVRAYEKERENG